MASREWRKPDGGLHTGLAYLMGYLAVAADGTVDTANTSFSGGVFAKPSGTGLYNLTLNDYYADILAVQVTPVKPNAAVTDWEIVSIPGKGGVSKGKVIQFRHTGASQAAANASQAGGICVTVWVKNSGLRA